MLCADDCSCMWSLCLSLPETVELILVLLLKKGENFEGEIGGPVDVDMERLLEDSVMCRVRAKRGCATHPRSIAERVLKFPHYYTICGALTKFYALVILLPFFLFVLMIRSEEHGLVIG